MSPLNRPTSEPSRRDAAAIDVGHTTVHPVVAFVLVSVVLGVLLAGQALQWTGQPSMTDQDTIARARALLGAIGSALQPGQTGEPLGDMSLPARIVSANRVMVSEARRIDDALDHESVVGRSLRPTAQLVLSGWLGAGNERAYCGRDGWLFYRADVEYLTGPGFLDSARMARRATDSEEWAPPPHPDPRAAIGLFVRQLQERAITLVVVPTPVKPAIHPEKLARIYEGAATSVQNPSFAGAVEAFESLGALVFDPTDALRAARDRLGRPQYLATDTHWRPESMELVAGQLADFVMQHVSLPPRADPGYRVEPTAVTAFGDLRMMLNLPANSRFYPAETVRLRRVLDVGGAPWRPSRAADVLVLGDSFSNIYALASMGWGESAGFVEHLSLALKRPVDRIVENDNGAFATRARLRHELASGVDRLAGKRVVIYQFSARELAFGDWKVLGAEPARGF